LCFFFGISVLLHVKRHSSGRTTFQGEDQSSTRLNQRRSDLHPIDGLPLRRQYFLKTDLINQMLSS
jgi:hypothetical protein